MICKKSFWHIFHVEYFMSIPFKVPFQFVETVSSKQNSILTRNFSVYYTLGGTRLLSRRVFCQFCKSRFLSWNSTKFHLLLLSIYIGRKKGHTWNTWKSGYLLVFNGFTAPFVKSFLALIAYSNIWNMSAICMMSLLFLSKLNSC